MKTTNFLIASSCRYCRYYQTEGRRGGMCQQLGVPVQAHWKACALAAKPFTSTWENLEDVVRLEKSLASQCPMARASTALPESTSISHSKKATIA